MKIPLFLAPGVPNPEENKMHKANRLFVMAAALVILSLLGLITASAQDKQDLDSTKIELTKEESIFLKAHPVIRFGTDARWEPYVIKKADGTIEGFDIDLIQYINKLTGTNIQIVTGRWAEIVEQAKELKIDGLTTSAASKERGQFFNFSESYISLFPAFVIAGSNESKIDGINDFTGKSVAVLKGNQFYLNLLGKYPSIKIIESPSEIDAIKLTIEGKAEAAIVATTFYNNYHKIFGQDIKIGYVATDNPLDIVYSVRKDWPELVSIINKALASLPKETKNNLFSHWFGFSLSEFGFNKKEESISLTAQEKVWINEHPDIRIGVKAALQPIEFIDEKGQHQGISSDYVQILNRRLNLNMKIVPNLSWLEVMEEVPKRGVDVLSGATKTSEREKYLNYTEPYLYIDWVIVSRTDTPPIRSLADLEGRLTSIREGSGSYEHIVKRYPGVHLLRAKDTLDSMQNVINGKAEAAVVELSAASLIIHSYRMYSLKIDQQVLQHDDPISLAVRNDWPELIQILNKGLASITPEERETIKQKWQAVPIQIGFTKMEVLRIVLSVIAVMTTVLLVFVFWNRRLKKEITERLKAEKKRKIAEKDLIESDEKYSKAFKTSPYVIIITQARDGKVIEVNDAFIAITGFSHEEALDGSSIGLNLWVNEEDRVKVVSDLIAGKAVVAKEYLFRIKNGTVITGLFSAQMINLRQEPCILSSINNITEQKKAEKEKANLEKQLIQAQKMESVGRLAGGVAHDYNNISSIIIGYSELALEVVSKEDPLHGDLVEILTAAKRSTDITRQLLAFARKQTVAPKVLDLNDTIGSMLKMLQRLIGEDIDFAWSPGAQLWPVKIDPTQIDQILANLCVNARDAITDVGKVTVETKNISFDEDYCADHLGFAPGDYVMMGVSDSGSGIAPEIMDKIFEPFFTNKKMGKGTGLGLSTVYGIVKQNDGFINAYSELKQGTTIKIYLPRHIGMAVEAYSENPIEIPLSKGETVLLVEDDLSILKLGKRILEDLGYAVMPSNSPSEAIKIAEEQLSKINLLITDVVMPEMNGRELSEHLQSLYPNIKTLFMSGYTANVIAHRGVLDAGVNFISKPFSKESLATKVREALDNANISTNK